MRRAIFFLAVLLTAACAPQQQATDESEKTAEAPAPKAPSQPIGKSADADNPCERVEFENVLLTHCLADPAEHRIAMVLGPEGGPPYRGLGGLAEARADEREKIAFAMNGGMFDAEGRPIGYYVEDGERLKKINTNEGPGNFHMLPNGVFFGLGGEWRVLPAETFKEKVTARPDFATQSGPMLVIDGELHPRIADDGESRFIRNGVGIDEDGMAHFVISEMPLSFGKLARYFRDELETDNALYLDGTVSALWNPATARIDARAPIGPMIVVEKRARPASEPAEPEESQVSASEDSEREVAEPVADDAKESE